MKTSQRKILFSGGEISYTLERKKVRNLNLRIRTDGSVYVSASARVPLARIDSFVQSHGEMILSAQRKFSTIRENAPKPCQYVTGEKIRILGQELSLVVEKGKPAVFAEGGRIHLRLEAVEDQQAREKLLEKYRDDLCKTLFPKLAQEVYPLFAPMGVEMPQLRLRKMKSRWGSCMYKKGIITLNKQLVSAPEECIRYVIVHEYCHFIHPDHSKNFYALMTKVLPDWKEKKVLLEQCAGYCL